MLMTWAHSISPMQRNSGGIRYNTHDFGQMCSSNCILLRVILMSGACICCSIRSLDILAIQLTHQIATQDIAENALMKTD